MSIELRAGDAVVTVVPQLGGRIAQITLDGWRLLIDDRARGPIGWGSYPMVPWAGRVGYAHFTFDGIDYHLDPLDPPHALHGVGFVQPWEATEVDERSLTMSCELDWPLGGRAEQRLELTADGLHQEVSVTATMVSMPAVVGWHPWFRRPAQHEVLFAAMYERGVDHLPTGRRVDVSAGPWDDAFVEPAHTPMVHSGPWTIELSSDCDVWVVYDERDDALCVEPQSAPPDAFRHGTAQRLDPGDALRRQLQWRWTRR